MAAQLSPSISRSSRRRSDGSMPARAAVARRDGAPAPGQSGHQGRSRAKASFACRRTGSGSACTARLGAERADTDFRQRRSCAGIEPARRCADARAAIPSQCASSGALAHLDQCGNTRVNRTLPAPRPTSPRANWPARSSLSATNAAACEAACDAHAARCRAGQAARRKIQRCSGGPAITFSGRWRGRCRSGPGRGCCSDRPHA